MCVCVFGRGGSLFLEINYPSTKCMLLLLFSDSNESDSLRTHGLEFVSLPCPWDSPSKNINIDPGDLPNPRIEPEFLVAPTLQADSLLLTHQESPVPSIRNANLSGPIAKVFIPEQQDEKYSGRYYQ